MNELCRLRRSERYGACDDEAGALLRRYHKGGKDAAKLTHRTHYIATREGVELLRSDNADLAPSDKQTAFIARALRQFPEAKELLEYEDSRAAPTRSGLAMLEFFATRYTEMQVKNPTLPKK